MLQARHEWRKKAYLTVVVDQRHLIITHEHLHDLYACQILLHFAPFHGMPHTSVSILRFGLLILTLSEIQSSSLWPSLSVCSFSRLKTVLVGCALRPVGLITAAIFGVLDLVIATL